MNKLLSGGGSAARLFSGYYGDRIALEKPGEGVPEGQTEFKAAADAVKKALAEVQAFAPKVEAEIKATGKLAEETKVVADKLLMDFGTKSTEFDARIADIEQKVARRGTAGAPQEVKTAGEMVVEDPEVKALLESKVRTSGRARMTLESKAILSATGTWGSTASVGNSLVAPQRAGMFPLPMRMMTVRDLLAQGETASNAIEYAVQVSFTNNAAVVAENTTKATSDLTTDLRSAAVRTIAHLMFASRQILDDAPMLRSFIDSQMRYGLQYAEEAELLYGDNTGQHLNGIVTQATAYSAPFVVTGGTGIDTIRLAMLQASTALLPADGVVLNPLDWAKIEVTRDGMGRYLIGDPQGSIQPRLWNLPVVESFALTAGNFLTGAFKTGAQIFDRMGIEVMISTEDSTNFQKNMVTIRCEERLALAVYRPGAFIYGALP